MNQNLLYQHSTLADLTAGLFSGTMLVSELLKHGDTGIGTGDGLDGELIILNGTLYQVTSTGVVNVLQPDDQVPFATVNFANYQPETAIQEQTRDETLAQIAGRHPWQNLFYSFQLTGKFSYMKTRSVKKQSKPYPTLEQAANDQAMFETHDVTGTMLGYYAPQLYNGVAVGGFHYHFLADDHDFGGHVLDFTVADAKLSMQAFTDLQEHFPATNPEFLNFDFAKHNDVASQIKNAEQ
ncbi:acetolactate decarboxylase [Fructilactobacillus cliffordii]|uniref:acetolactate decarboxylase n=1 Tax=Fructilactobacillus cliffordii TaxID=2940299 RepID=UPI0020935397|nr:acetolactate decarboxylase [Fructilactobacillus cliffordii]USS86855.1 acetolactate decarboxylase [Fructilactobacillus cliffordii]